MRATQIPRMALDNQSASPRQLDAYYWCLSNTYKGVGFANFALRSLSTFFGGLRYSFSNISIVMGTVSRVLGRGRGALDFGVEFDLGMPSPWFSVITFKDCGL